MRRAFIKYKTVLLYGSSLALLLFLLRWLELRFIIFSDSLELFTAGIAILFTGLGIWLTLKLSKPKKETIIIEKEVLVTPGSVINETEAALFNLSKRELEVLQLMAKGLSNAEIAEQLFVSLNTIKTHSSKIFEKLEVKRRTQAAEKAKQLNIIN
jgi:DNA-binding CsgD family transcriptional regulator